MKATEMVFIGLLIVLLVSVPVAADAHWGFGGGLLLGFGTGLITGFAFAPGPVYVSPRSSLWLFGMPRMEID